MAGGVVSKQPSLERKLRRKGEGGRTQAPSVKQPFALAPLAQDAERDPSYERAERDEPGDAPCDEDVRWGRDKGRVVGQGRQECRRRDGGDVEDVVIG